MNKIIQGDSLEELKKLEDNSIDCIVTDPPYGLSFMGKKWDYDVPSTELWSECLRVLKPGGYLLAFAGTRTQHRMAVRIEDAGFEIRDMIMYVYGSGFPKSLNLQKALIKKCKCGIMEEYERTKQNTQSQVRFVPNPNLSETISNQQTEGEVLQSQLSEQNLQIQQSQPTKNVWGEESSMERRSNVEENTWKLQGSNLPEMSTGVFANGKEGRVHNATQTGDGSTLETITNENGSSASYRPQSEQQQDREPCAFCKQWGTQETRRLFEETDGFGSALKPACEPITVARKPISEKTLIDNYIKWGVGGINIDGCRVEAKDGVPLFNKRNDLDGSSFKGGANRTGEIDNTTGRFPANLIHDNSEEVRECFPETNSGNSRTGKKGGSGFGFFDDEKTKNTEGTWHGGSGNASRFFKSIIYQAKASKSERNRGCEGLEEKIGAGNYMADAKWINDPRHKDGGYMAAPSKPQTNSHPTVKPIALMEYLVKLVSKEGHTVLDPFAGSGTTGIACKKLNRNFIGIERESDYVKIAEARINNI